MNVLTDMFDKAKDLVTSLPRTIEDENWFALPNWMRRHQDAVPHNGDKEKARRIRQMASGYITAANRGSVVVQLEEE